MNTQTCQAPSIPAPRRFRIDPVAILFVVILAVLGLLEPAIARDSLAFTVDSLLGIAPFLLASILLTAYAAASDLDALVARSFSGSVLPMIALAALAGAVSPFCSCGVIPLIAALLAMRVPLPAVMAFWLASPLMDPSMFVLTAGALGLEFALYKTAAAVVTGCLGGLTVLALGRTGAFTDTLRPGVGASRCSASNLLSERNVTWTFWRESARLDAFLRSATRTTLFLGKWLALAYLLESVLLIFVPQEQVVAFIGGQGIRSTLLAVLVGIPAYLNGYAALPLVGGLLEQGMDPAAGMAFLLAGGVTSIPAAMAVFALVRLRVFAVYLGVALVAALGLGTGYGLIAG